MSGKGNIGGYLDLAQVMLYLFWIFFAGLIYYLHRENKREGYPLDSDRTVRSDGRVKVVGFPPLPAPKTYRLPHGGKLRVPNDLRDQRPLDAVPVAAFPGAPLEPNGDPMLAGIGPGAFAMRSDMPDLTYDGLPKIVPLRIATDFDLAPGERDPRGLPVVGCDGGQAGKVRELWVDRSECVLRYLELEPDAGSQGASPTAGSLIPITFARITARAVRIEAILGRQFAQVPRTRSPDAVTLLEEDRICAYFGAGTLYATPDRRESRL